MLEVKVSFYIDLPVDSKPVTVWNEFKSKLDSCIRPTDFHLWREVDDTLCRRLLFQRIERRRVMIKIALIILTVLIIFPAVAAILYSIVYGDGCSCGCGANSNAECFFEDDKDDSRL